MRIRLAQSVRFRQVWTESDRSGQRAASARCGRRRCGRGPTGRADAGRRAGAGLRSRDDLLAVGTCLREHLVGCTTPAGLRLQTGDAPIKDRRGGCPISSASSGPSKGCGPGSSTGSGKCSTAAGSAANRRDVRTWRPRPLGSAPTRSHGLTGESDERSLRFPVQRQPVGACGGPCCPPAARRVARGVGRSVAAGITATHQELRRRSSRRPHMPRRPALHRDGRTPRACSRTWGSGVPRQRRRARRRAAPNLSSVSSGGRHRSESRSFRGSIRARSRPRHSEAAPRQEIGQSRRTRPVPLLSHATDHRSAVVSPRHSALDWSLLTGCEWPPVRA